MKIFFFFKVSQLVLCNVRKQRRRLESSEMFSWLCHSFAEQKKNILKNFSGWNPVWMKFFFNKNLFFFKFSELVHLDERKTTSKTRAPENVLLRLCRLLLTKKIKSFLHQEGQFWEKTGLNPKHENFFFLQSFTVGTL